MSLFITSLAFEEEIYMYQAKLGIFLASFLAGIIGYLILRYSATTHVRWKRRVASPDISFRKEVPVPEKEAYALHEAQTVKH